MINVFSWLKHLLRLKLTVALDTPVRTRQGLINLQLPLDQSDVINVIYRSCSLRADHFARNFLAEHFSNYNVSYSPTLLQLITVPCYSMTKKSHGCLKFVYLQHTQFFSANGIFFVGFTSDRPYQETNNLTSLCHRADASFHGAL